MQVLEAVTTMSRKLGPYVLLELLLPGGTLFALLLFAYRHPTKVRRYAVKARIAALRAYVSTREAVADRARGPRR